MQKGQEYIYIYTAAWDIWTSGSKYTVMLRAYILDPEVIVQEEAGLAKAYRQIITNLISDNSGRVVDSSGDNILPEFRSSVNAVECAVNKQKKLVQENSKHTNDKKVQFRIGVNVGDVIQVRKVL